MHNILILLFSYTRFFALSGGGDVVVRNPFSLTRVDGEGVKMEMSLYGARSRERWGILTYDRYDNTVGDMSIYGRTSLYSNMPSFIAAYARKNFAVSVAYIPLLNYDYRYEKNLKDANYLPSNNYDIKRSGGISLLGIGGEGRYRKFYVGAFVSYGKGEIRQTDKYPDTTIVTALSLKGFIPYVYIGGGLENVSFSVGFNPEVKFTSNPLPAYPMSIYVNINLFRASPLMDRATFDFIYRFYEKAGYLTDGFTLLAGLEHTAFNNFFFNVKAGVEKTYVEEATYIPIYQITFGQKFQGIKVAGGLEYQIVKYSRRDAQSGEYASVSENTLKFKFGVSILP